MDTLKPCIICYKSISSTNKHEPDKPWATGQKTLIKFFNSLKRYLDESGSLVGGGTQIMGFPIEHVIQSGIYSCEDCLEQLESFCQLYHQIKSTELLLSWKMSTLMNIMSCAQRVPSRLAKFRDMVEELELEDITADEIIDFRRDLIKNCERKDRDSFPKLQLQKCHPSKGEMRQAKKSKRILSPFMNDEENNISQITNCSKDNDNLTGPNETGIRSNEIQIQGPAENGVKVEDHPGILPDSELEDFSQPAYNEAPHFIQSSQDQFSQNVPHLDVSIVGCKSANLMRNEGSKILSNIVPAEEEATTAASGISVQQFETNAEAGETNSSVSLGSGDNGDNSNMVTYKMHIYKRYADVRSHQETLHDLQSKHFCKVCRKSFSTAKNLRRHYNSVHLKLRSRICKVCRKSFSDAKNLRRHYNSVHLKLRSHSCNLCGKAYTRKESLDAHQRTNHI